MTGMNLFDKAMEMLGYASADGISGKDDMLKKALTLINLVYADLWFAFEADPKKEPFKPLNRIGDEIALPERILHDVAPYGLAMFLAQSESDADNQQLYAALYNRKRKGYNRVETVIDRLPGIGG